LKQMHSEAEILNNDPDPDPDFDFDLNGAKRQNPKHEYRVTKRFNALLFHTSDVIPMKMGIQE